MNSRGSRCVPRVLTLGMAYDGSLSTREFEMAHIFYISTHKPGHEGTAPCIVSATTASYLSMSGWRHHQSYVIANPLVSIDNEGRNPKVGQSCRHLESAVTGTNDKDRWIDIIKVYFMLTPVLPAFVV